MLDAEGVGECHPREEGSRRWWRRELKLEDGRISLSLRKDACGTNERDDIVE